MTTPVMMPVIVVMLQFYSGSGTAVPVPRQGNTSVMSTFFSIEDCDRERYSRGHSKDFFCLEYKSEKIIDYTFPADKQRQGSMEPNVVGPIALKDVDKPYIEPLVEPKQPQTKRVVRKQRQQPSAIGSLLAFFTPNW
jgi:hypothetical protein